jgi:hypothetical protein
VDLAHLIRFLVVKLTHPDSNTIFDIGIAFTTNYSLGGDVPIDSETFLVIDFVNLMIKLAQSFRCIHRGKICVFIGCARIYINICIFTVFLK